ncbi:MAG: carboxypeptidase-like regulatory domain-containing protein, partial [Gemmatimonadaceae bacterium]|nr:carboxypeptidase-like regulatory domain-containing protein [Gemmatimonadaceae bacterium]
MLRRLLLAFVTGFVAAAFPLAAQTTEVIRGRIIAPDSSPVANARVTVTSIGGNVSRQARTDAQGRYTVTFPGGDGDYWVSIAAIGFAAKRFELKRTADQDVLIADAKLQPAASVLDAVEVTAPRDRVRRTDVPPDISGSEQQMAQNLNAVPADQWGDLAAMAASLPGVQLVPGQDGGANGYSVLGLGADQNNATLNGLGFGGAGLPRDAAVSSSLVTSPYDVSRGGFSGGQIQLRTRPGSNFRVRGTSFNLDAPPLQYTDPAARALGQLYTNASLGGIASGPLAIDQAFYNVSWQLGRRMNDFRTVVNTDADGLRTTGLSAD